LYAGETGCTSVTREITAIPDVASAAKTHTDHFVPAPAGMPAPDHDWPQKCAIISNGAMDIICFHSRLCCSSCTAGDAGV